MILPTGLGWRAVFFGAVLVVAFYAAPYRNLLFLLLAYGAATTGLSVLWTAGNLRGLRGEVAASECGRADRGVPVTTRVRINHGGTARNLACQLRIAGRRGWHDVANLALVDGEGRATSTVDGLARGLWPVQRTRAISSYPFGLFRRTAALDGPTMLVVAPTPASIHGRTAADILAAYEGHGNGARGTMPASLRPFRTGDGFGDIHWRATARRGSPVVVEREPEQDNSIHLWLDRRQADEEFEGSLRQAAGFGLWARNNGATLSLTVQEGTLSFGGNGAAWQELDRWLAAAETLPPSAAPPPTRPPSALALEGERSGR